MNKYYLSLISASALWGFQPIAIKFVVAEMNVSTMIPIRYLLLGRTLFIIMYLRGEHSFLPPKKHLLMLILMGLTGVTISNGAQFEGLKYSTVANATLISAACPAITALLAAVFIHERLRLRQWVGIAVSMSGALYLISGGSWETIAHTSFNFGDILFIIGEAGWAACCLLSYPVMKEMSVLSVTAWYGLFGAAGTAVYGSLTEGLTFPVLSPIGLISFAFVTWGGGVAAMLLWNLGLKYTGASTASIFLNLMPIIGMISAALTINEIISFKEIIGAVVIISGVYITTH